MLKTIDVNPDVEHGRSGVTLIVYFSTILMFKLLVWYQTSDVLLNAEGELYVTVWLV